MRQGLKYRHHAIAAALEATNAQRRDS